MNKAILMGRLTRDPEVRYSQNNLQITNFTLAVDRRFTRQGEERQADFIPIVTFGKTAEFCEKYYRKGQRVLVCGRIQTRSYDDKEGIKRYVTEIVCDEAHFADSKNQPDSGYGGGGGSYGTGGGSYGAGGGGYGNSGAAGGTGSYGGSGGGGVNGSGSYGYYPQLSAGDPQSPYGHMPPQSYGTVTSADADMGVGAGPGVSAGAGMKTGSGSPDGIAGFQEQKGAAGSTSGVSDASDTQGSQYGQMQPDDGFMPIENESDLPF